MNTPKTKLPSEPPVRSNRLVMRQRLTDMRLLEGKTEEISMTALRERPGDVIDQVQMGKTFKITKAGKLVAILAAPEPTALEIGAKIRRLGLQGA